MKRFSKLFGGALALILAALLIVLLVPARAGAAETRTDALMDALAAAKENQFEGRYTPTGLPLARSSNPYDYILDDARYSALVALGTESLDELALLQQDSGKYDSFERYLIAIAIEEIAKVDLKNFPAYAWQDADSFAAGWTAVTGNAAAAVEEILSDPDLDADAKQARICAYGLLAVEPLENLREAGGDAALIEEALETVSSGSRDETVQRSLA